MPLLHPPAWAVLQRRLIDEMSRSVRVYLAAYTHGAGARKHELIWGDALPSRDGADDFGEECGLICREDASGHRLRFRDHH